MKILTINILFVIILMISGLLCYTSLTNGHDWGGDFSQYIMQAKSIVECNPLDFIKSNQFTIEKSSYPLGPTMAPIAYPWGFPILLAPIYALFGFNMIALKSVSVVCFLLFISVLWIAFRKYHSNYWRILFFCLFAFNPFLINFSNNIVSDIPFLLLSTISVMLIGAVVVEKQVLYSQYWDHILLGSVIAVAYLIRSNGILLLFALFITQLILHVNDNILIKCDVKLIKDRPRFSQLKHSKYGNYYISLIPYLTFALLILLMSSLLPDGGSSYISLINYVSIKSIYSMIDYNIKQPADFFDKIPNKYVIFGASVPLAVNGMMIRWRSDIHIISYMLLTILLFTIWPFGQGLRYLFPILPFYISYVLTSLEGYNLTDMHTKYQINRIICSLPIVIIIVSFAYLSTKGAYNNINDARTNVDGPYVESSKAMFDYLIANTNSQSTIVFFKPRVMRMMTGRKSIMINSIDEISRGDYICIYKKPNAYQLTNKDIESLMANQRLKQVFTNTDIKIYQMIKSVKNT